MKPKKEVVSLNNPLDELNKKFDSLNTDNYMDKAEEIVNSFSKKNPIVKTQLNIV